MEFLIFLGTYCVTIAFQSSNVTDLSLILVSFPYILRHVPARRALPKELLESVFHSPTQ